MLVQDDDVVHKDGDAPDQADDLQNKIKCTESSVEVKTFFFHNTIFYPFIIINAFAKPNKSKKYKVIFLWKIYFNLDKEHGHYSSNFLLCQIKWLIIHFKDY